MTRTTPMMSTLSANGLGLRLSKRWILQNVSLEIQSGMVLALIGPNGSGKSSVMRCLAGLWHPTEGEVLIDGQRLDLMRRSIAARHIAYVPQDARLDFEFSVREIVSMGRYAHRGRFQRETNADREAINDAIQRADVVHLSERLITQLSGGERQRVLIARSLATCANILLLDEPTASLDVDHGLDVLELCRSLADEGRAVVIATHDLNAVYRFADQACLIDAGRLIAQGRPSSVLTTENIERVFHVRSEILAATGGNSFLLFHRLN